MNAKLVELKAGLEAKPIEADIKKMQAEIEGDGNENNGALFKTLAKQSRVCAKAEEDRDKNIADLEQLKAPTEAAEEEGKKINGQLAEAVSAYSEHTS